MKKKMSIRKKSLAIILSLSMAVCALSGCTMGNEPAEPVVETEDDDELEVPEVKGKEETVGSFSLLVPKGMSADEDGSENAVILTDDEDEDKYIRIQIADKNEAKEYVSALVEEDDNYSEEEFTLEGIKWTGASYKKSYVFYGKVDKKIVFVTAEGYKSSEDITLAVLASLEIDEDAEAVAIGGGAGKGGTFTYGDGLFTVEYSGFYRPAESSELGDLVATDGSQTVYVTAFADIDSAIDAYDALEEYDCSETELSVDDYDGYLVTYEDWYHDTIAEFFLPLEYYHENGNYTMTCVYIKTSGDDYEEAVNDEFMALINSIKVDETYMTDTLIDDGGSSTGSGSGSGDDWYGYYSGYIVLTGTDAWEGQDYYWDDLDGVIGTNGERSYFEAYSDEMDLWDGDWSREGTPIFTFWVDFDEDNKMIADTTEDAWILDESDLEDASSYLWWYDWEIDDPSLYYDYYDPEYGGGFEIAIYLTRK